MGKWIQTGALFLASIALLIDPAFAHHVTGGRVPVTFADGLLSGLAHPITINRIRLSEVMGFAFALPILPICELLRLSKEGDDFCSVVP